MDRRLRHCCFDGGDKGDAEPKTQLITKTRKYKSTKEEMYFH